MYYIGEGEARRSCLFDMAAGEGESWLQGGKSNSEIIGKIGLFLEK
jgi:hypothetical protein